MQENRKGVNKKVFLLVILIAIAIVIAIVLLVIGRISANQLTEKQAKGGTAPEKSNVSKTLNIDKITQSNEVMDMKEDASGDKVPVPKGYVGSSVEGENEIDTGYVIYEGTEEVTEANVATAQTERNQFVWVPVPDPSTVYGIDSNGKLWGKLYNFGTSSSSKNPLEPLNWNETAEGLIQINSTSSNTSYREPAILTSYDMDFKLTGYDLGAKTTHEFQMQLEKEFYQAIESIEKYGGFYIGRYETGNLAQDTIVVRKGNTDIVNQTWYSVYKKCKTLANSNVKTSMIWGSQWDATMNWMLTSENEEVETFVRDSTRKGNYTGSRKATGSSEDYKVNNIYDMAGNVYDRTLEADSSRSRVYRGGDFCSSGTSYPASSRYIGVPTFSYSLLGCRVVLFM